jgi:hypothetical protein
MTRKVVIFVRFRARRFSGEIMYIVMLNETNRCETLSFLMELYRKLSKDFQIQKHCFNVMFTYELFDLAQK